MATTKATKTAATETKATTTPVETKATVASTTEAKATAKKATKSTTEAKATTKKATTTKKAAAKTTTTATKTSKKAVEPQVSYLLQFSGKEVNTTNILETVKTVWVEKFQGKLEEIKTIEIYFKPEENRAYFVVNGLSNGDYFVEL